MLATKLYIPRVRANLAPRPRLTQRLDGGLERRLTLVSAPAGFGKSTLIAEWARLRAAGATPLPIVQLSLDPGDDDPGASGPTAARGHRARPAGVDVRGALAEVAVVRGIVAMSRLQLQEAIALCQHAQDGLAVAKAGLYNTTLALRGAAAFNCVLRGSTSPSSLHPFG